MLPAGNWKLGAATRPRLDSSSMDSAASSSAGVQPPKAVFVRLSDELLQQLKAAQPGNHAALQLELGVPSSELTAAPGSTGASVRGAGHSQSSTQIPLALHLGNSSYALAKPAANNRKQVTDILEHSHTNPSGSSSLQLAASNLHGQYEVGPSTSIRHHGQPKEKTAANMGERIRERNAQMLKEKESRKIVLVEDDGFSSSGSRGKKASSKMAKVKPALLRPSAISAKRSASPAGVAARQSPSLAPSATLTSTISRPPSRLVANEAAKGLMKKSSKLQNVLGTTIEGKAESAGEETKGVGAVGTSSDTITPMEAAQVAVQHKSPPPQQSKPVVQAPASEQATLAYKLGSPARRQFHQMKVDADDLASASSESEDEADKPLAARTQLPSKAHSEMEHLPTDVPKPSVDNKMVKQAKVHEPALSAVPKPVSVYAAAKSATSASDSSDKEVPKVAPTVTNVTSAAIPKRLSPGSAPISRASSPARATGGPQVVARTSGGARLSKRLPKVPTKTSPKAKAVPAASLSDSSSSLASSGSTSRPSASPPSAVKAPTKSGPIQSDTSATKSATLSVDSAARPSSRAPSPLPSPGLHTLPAKPPVSPSFNRHANLQPSPNKPTPPSPSLSTADKDKTPSQSSRPSLLSIGLPANPITGVMPNIPKSPSSLHPTYSHSSYPNHASSSHSTPGASPIVSHFPSNNSTRASKSPNSEPLRTTTKGPSAAKRKDAPVSGQANASTSDSGSNKKQKLNGGSAISSAPSPLSATTGSEEDGEGEEEEEGEYRVPAKAPVTGVPPSKDEKMDTGRPQEVGPVQGASAKVPSEKAQVLRKGGLPSFRKIGRMSELQKERGRDDSVPARSQSVSRANTPVSHGLMSSSISDRAHHAPSSSFYKPKFTGHLRITDDAEFVRRSSDFKDVLYPQYAELHTRLEKMKEDLLSPKKVGSPSSWGYSEQQISRMVDEVNERSKELERIKHALWQYDDDRKIRRDSSSRGRRSSIWND